MKNRSVKIITISFSVIAVALLLVYMYVYKGARDIATEEAVYTLSAEQLVTDYEADMQAANTKYLNKTIAVAGTVTQVADSILTIDSAVFCTFSNKQNIAADEKVTIKGRCIGYDEIFGEVKLDQCTTKD
ncbi:OB-fold putative lipoprotein [Flavobacterium litorale]|uniref:OB-fold putative lipoprotein n=1 Tax=Flavobacterium litorale TaxID=2856519 RepID=A0ABX8VDK4_9FLAO|nr:OB-fold putative lipoprotein [Flavobacterium litorale]QYJ68739.1 OB-fold putative lipoprotein [Flavobacterium litorale]